jgi:PTH1 family peptidyl-tRNA hydrolase
VKKGLILKFIVGIGNPGNRYAASRHNVGFLTVDAFSSLWGIRISRKQAHALIGEGTCFGEPVILVKPATYVNRSGLVAARLIELYQGRIEDLLVVCDDFNLPLGTLRIRKGGGDGGHKGLRSVADCLGQPDFPRIRVGIGQVPDGMDAVDFVLGTWEDEQQTKLQSTLDRVCEGLSLWMRTGDLNAVMNRFN